MKRMVIFLAVVLLLSGVVLQTAASAVVQTGEHNLITRYSVEQTTSSGEGYRLATLAWQVDGTASGSGYILRSPTGPNLRGNGCCCTFIPCLLRSH